jgi:hypothetical protein
LIRCHPGIVLLKKKHLKKITSAKEQWMLNHSQEPGWLENKDGVLAKLIWYEWWIKWALNNCEYPAIYNI